jgi:cold shock CspA family protein
MKARVLGRCVTFNGSYAFLRPIGDYSKDIFAHESELPGGMIHVGDKCTFDVSPDPYKPNRTRATNVRLIDEGGKADDEKPNPGMFAQPSGLSHWTRTTGMAEGLRKLMNRGQEE